MIKLHLVCSTDDLRPTLCHIKFTSENAIGCDGSVLVIAKVKDVLPDILEEGESFYIHSKDWKKAKAYDAVKFKRDGKTIICYDRKNRETAMPICFEDELDRQYPDVGNAIPSSFEADLNQIAFNPSHFARIVESVGCQYGKLSFSAVNKAIKVEPFDSYHHSTFADVVAIMMPTFFGSQD